MPPDAPCDPFLAASLNGSVLQVSPDAAPHTPCGPKTECSVLRCWCLACNTRPFRVALCSWRARAARAATRRLEWSCRRETARKCGPSRPPPRGQQHCTLECIALICSVQPCAEPEPTPVSRGQTKSTVCMVCSALSTETVGLGASPLHFTSGDRLSPGHA